MLFLYWPKFLRPVLFTTGHSPFSHPIIKSPISFMLVVDSYFFGLCVCFLVYWLSLPSGQEEAHSLLLMRLFAAMSAYSLE